MTQENINIFHCLIVRIINPKLYFPITEENLQETIKNEQLALVQIEEGFYQIKIRHFVSSSKPFKQKVAIIISVMNFLWN